MMNTTANPIPYTLTGNQITVMLDSDLKSLDRDSAAGIEAVAELQKSEPDIERLRVLFAPLQNLGAALDNTGVEIVGNVVTYNSKPLPRHLAERIIDIAALGLSVEPWKRFVARLMANPSKQAREELHLFLQTGNMPITEDGCFLAFKRVRDNYTDIHSGTFDNTPGTVVTMERTEVDDDRRRTCSTGLHFCSKDYLPHFGSWGGNRVVIVKVDPADVVSIPHDYNNTKGRTWRYEVVDEVETPEEVDSARWNRAYADDVDYSDDEFDDIDVDDYEYDVEDDEDLDWDTGVDVTTVRSEQAFVAPGPERKGVWQRARTWITG